MSKDIRKELFEIYEISREGEGDFLFKTELLLENAAFPTEQKYAVNLMELWNIYMPNYPFHEILLEYSRKYCPVLRYLNAGNIGKFESTKLMQKAAIKNFLKYQIIHGTTEKKELIQLCYRALQNVANRNYLYQDIQDVFQEYFPSGQVSASCLSFVKKFYDDTDKPFQMIYEQLEKKGRQSVQNIDVRQQFAAEYSVPEEEMAQFQTRLNIFLCRTALSDSVLRFSEHLREQWEKIFPELEYDDNIYQFVEKQENAYFVAGCHSIEKIGNKKVLESLYKDSVILCVALDAANQDKVPESRETDAILDEENCIRFTKLTEEFNRMKNGFVPEILKFYQNDIEEFHTRLVEKLGHKGERDTRAEAKRDVQTAKLIGKEQQIEELNKKIEKLTVQLSAEKDRVLTELIQQLDHQNYGHVLGKLHQIAYSQGEIAVPEAKTVITNFFEILKLYDIEAFGTLNTPVSQEEIEQDKYRLDHEIQQKAVIKYSGYLLHDSVILKPVAEEE